METTSNDIRKLPIGIQSFEKIREDNYLYVDKTAYIYELVHGGVPYFLSRPRRFGKSLLISTMEAYFSGKKELFEGLAIDEMEKEWKTYPVLHLDLNARKYESKEDLYSILNQYLEKWESLYSNAKQTREIEERFTYIIEQAYEQTGLPVVVLIDEYDKPLLQSISNEALHSELKKILKSFYGVLKSTDRYLKFIFLTGVTKFGQVSVFSDLNQLNDISLDVEYAAICGITSEELTATFEPELHRLADYNRLSFHEAVEAMTRQYDGYHFHPAASGVFNPFSVLNVLQKKEFRNYWFQTGTPTFLVELLKQTNFDLRELDGIELPAAAFADYRADALQPVPVIYQSGYLTIQGYNREFGLYTLGYPNEEVKYGFLNFLTPYYVDIPINTTPFYIGKFVEELRRGDPEAFLVRLQAFFADFPYELNSKTERHYQVVFYLVFKLLGQFTEAEARSAKGRADTVVKTRDYIYVFEFKLDGDVAQAMRQIEEKGYLLPYSADGRRLVKVAVSFSAEERNMEEWRIEGI